MSSKPGALSRKDVRCRFDRAAAHFDESDFLHRTTNDGMFDRMLPMQVETSRIIDLGCATGRASRLLASRFRRNRIISVDISGAMLMKARSARGRFTPIREVQADAAALPFASGTADLVFANLLLPWIHDLHASLGEVARVLRKGGLFMFSTLGPDSLIELRQAWQSIDSLEHINQFADMHDIGDTLVRCGLHDPVLDIDNLTLRYPDIASLYRDLTNAGARNCLLGRRRSLTPKGDLRAFERCLETQIHGSMLSIRIEVIYGHAWGGGPPGEYRVEAAQIPRRRR